MKSSTYKNAGVDIEKADNLIKYINLCANQTKSKAVISGIGSFGGLFALKLSKYKNPVLVSSTDGVGTKLMLAQANDMHKTIGYDLVGMCVNDVATTGAEPLFFLDYIATGKIQTRTLKDIVSGISNACKESGYALIGGETAEMPGMYSKNHYDLAGFCVGIIDKKNIIDGKNIKNGDAVIGLASNGLHSNGFSLVRKVFNEKQQRKYSKELLKPTKLYTQPLLELQKNFCIKGIAHITGGSFKSKVSRIIPSGLCAYIKTSAWPVPEIFMIIQQEGNITSKEMFHVFNMGIGMVVVVSAKDKDKIITALKKQRIRAWEIGVINTGKEKVKLI